MNLGLVHESKKEFAAVFLNCLDFQRHCVLTEVSILKEVLDRLRIGAESIYDLLLEAIEFLNICGRGNPLIHPETLAGVSDISLRNADVQIQIDARRDLFFRSRSPQLSDRLFQQPAVEVKTHGIYVSMLFPAKQTPSTANLEIERGNPESGPQLTKLTDRSQAFAGYRGEHIVGRNEEVRVCPAIASAHAPSKLIELGQAV